MFGGTVAVTPDFKVQKQISALLLKDGELQVFPAAVFDFFPKEQLAYWCNREAVYGLPTTELVSFLKERIGTRSAIEIGSGVGALGKALGIPCTDSYMQEVPEVKNFYALTGQPPVRYGAHVEKLEALDAVAKYNPKVVVAQWVTEYVSPLSKPGALGGSVYGVREEQMLKHIDEYILVGHEGVHSQKAISPNVNETLRPAWLRSRSLRLGNVIYVWTGKGTAMPS